MEASRVQSSPSNPLRPAIPRVFSPGIAAFPRRFALPFPQPRFWPCPSRSHATHRSTPSTCVWAILWRCVRTPCTVRVFTLQPPAKLGCVSPQGWCPTPLCGFACASQNRTLPIVTMSDSPPPASMKSPINPGSARKDADIDVITRSVSESWFPGACAAGCGGQLLRISPCEHASCAA